MANLIYSPAEFATIVKNCKDYADLDEIKNYLLENAPGFIEQYGAHEYYAAVSNLRHKKVLIYREKNK